MLPCIYIVFNKVLKSGFGFLRSIYVRKKNVYESRGTEEMGFKLWLNEFLSFNPVLRGDTKLTQS